MDRSALSTPTRARQNGARALSYDDYEVILQPPHAIKMRIMEHSRFRNPHQGTIWHPVDRRFNRDLA